MFNIPGGGFEMSTPTSSGHLWDLIGRVAAVITILSALVGVVLWMVG